MAVTNARKKDDEVSERESSEYVQVMGISISVLALVSSFVYTTMTLILIEVADVGAFLWQSTLLILFFSFTLFLNLTYMHLVRIWVARRRRHYPRSAQISKLPRVIILNLLETLAMLLWWTSLPLMFLAKNLLYLALASLITIIASLPIGYVSILKPMLTSSHTQNLKSEK